MITVNLGTAALETAITILAPSLAIPPASYWRPTMKPVMFCRNSSGIPRWLHSSMKWAPFNALSEKSTPLLATTPTGYPQMREKPQTRGFPVPGLELVEAAAVHDAGDDLADVVLPPVVRRHDAVKLRRVVLRRLRRGDLEGRLPAAHEVLDDVAG